MTADNGWTGERAEVLSRLATLALSIQNVESMVRDMRDALREQQEQQASTETAVQEMRLELERRWQEVRTVEAEVQKIEPLKQRVINLERLAPAMKVVIWIGAALGLSVLALIWALITGQATLVMQ